MADPYVVASWVCCVVAVLAFAMYSVVMMFVSQRKKAREGSSQQTAEDFVTARKTATMSQIAWSFYATSVGAWVIVTPASFANFAGWIGMVMYAVSCGIPIIIIALFGLRLQKLFPNCASLSDFCGLRFGWGTQLLVVLLTLFNMGIVIIAEFTTIGALFSQFVNTLAWPFIVLVAVLTLTYTAYGGLRISIITDQVQAICGIIIIVILCIYLMVTFRFPLGPLPEYLGPNFSGYSSILTLPLSLMAASVFSEALWQRVWASTDERTLKNGAYLGCALVIVVVFLFGLFGFLAAWAGLITEETNYNLYLFQIFKSDPTQANAMVDNWVGVLIMILAVTMNESAIDSIQNGLASSISCRFFLSTNVHWIRLIVVLMNIPLVAIALAGLDVLSLFLVTNMLTICGMVPVMMGMYSGPGESYISDGMPPLCFVLSFIGTSIYGCSTVWDPSDPALSIRSGITMAWYGNQYAYDFFLVAIGTSVAAMALWISLRVFCDKVLKIWKPTLVDWDRLQTFTRHAAPADQEEAEPPLKSQDVELLGSVADTESIKAEKKHPEPGGEAYIILPPAGDESQL